MSTGIIVDNFAGGGGASTGIELALGRPIDVAINHNKAAVAMHMANHPATKHYCEDVFKVDPHEVAAGRPVDLAWFSPDCTHFSKAKGGKPRSKKIRGLAWVVIRWATTVKPRVIMLENVEEFEHWGPLLENGQPCPIRKGFTFRRWLRALTRAGYQVEMKQLRACDYGAPTTRRRLFIIARCDGRPIVWPEPTHGPGRLPYRTAAECIDWTLPCPSIFLTKEEGKAIGVRRPLADATLRRIARGLHRYVLKNPRPFVVKNMTNNVAKSVDEPLSTILTGTHHMLVTPHIMTTDRPVTNRSLPRSPLEPLVTVTGNSRLAVIAPTLVQTGYGEREGQAPRSLDVEAPLGTVVAGGAKHGLVQAFLAKHYGGNETPGTDLDRPMDTVTTQDHHALIASSLVKLKGTCKDGQRIDEPAPTIQAQGQHIAEVRAFLLKYYGTNVGSDLFDSMHTITSKPRMGLVTVHGVDYQIVDIGMRMLSPRELYNAQGFPADYNIDGFTKTDQIKMCGNSVSPPMAAALVRANLGHLAADAEAA